MVRISLTCFMVSARRPDGRRHSLAHSGGKKSSSREAGRQRDGCQGSQECRTCRELTGPIRAAKRPLVRRKDNPYRWNYFPSRTMRLRSGLFRLAGVTGEKFVAACPAWIRQLECRFARAAKMEIRAALAPRQACRKRQNQAGPAQCATRHLAVNPSASAAGEKGTFP